MSDDERVTRHERELAALKQLAFGLAADDTEELFPAVQEALDRVETVETRLDQLDDVNDMLADVADEKNTKEEKVGAIVAYADGKRSEDQPAAIVRRKAVKSVTGVKRRYSYTLIDDLIDEYPWAHDPSEVSRRGDAERDGTGKRLLIDFEGAHGEPCPVSKHITQPSAEGVAD